MRQILPQKSNVQRLFANEVSLSSYSDSILSIHGISNLRFVQDHPAAFIDARHVVICFLERYFETERVDAAAVAYGQVSRGFLAGIKMLMKPIARRAVDTALAPFDLGYLVLVAVGVGVETPLLVPKQYVADGLRADDNRAWAMVVRFVIFPHRPFAQVADESVSRHLELSQAQSGAFDFEFSRKQT
jgi:hypothetical protein